MAKTATKSHSNGSVKGFDPLDYIIIEGARVNNLKNVSVALPRNQFITITGLSGSGKSSLAFDTLFAEGQRRYVESLSAYVRQFMGNLQKPNVDKISGISPAVAIEQKAITRNPRSTVGTSTEVYDYMKLLFARIGRTYSPVSGEEVKRDTVSDVVDYINGLKKGTKIILRAPYEDKEEKGLRVLLQQGFTRISLNGEIVNIEEHIEANGLKTPLNVCSIVIDRIIVSTQDDDANTTRISDSVMTSFYEGGGVCEIDVVCKSPKVKKTTAFSNKFELDDILFEHPSEHFFSFNNPYGACKSCEGFGSIIGIDEGLVIPDKGLSIFEDAIACWKGQKMQKWKEKLIATAAAYDFPIHRPYIELNQEQKDLLWTGNKHFKGLNTFFQYIERKSYKIQYRVMLSRYRGKTKCPECKGTRLRADADYVKVGGRSIIELVLWPASKLLLFFKELKLNEHDQQIARRLLLEITSRLTLLCDVGLEYLTLNRLSNTLSGGESQRINLSTSIGSSLVGAMYILDEPSIGLHPRDTDRLISVLKSLRDLGNTVIVVEHDEEIMKASDEIVDLGPLAGMEGGELIFHGGHESLLKEKRSLTAQYLNGVLNIEVPEKRRKWKKYIEVKGARENNLKGIDVKFPLGVLTVVSGVSGSGKSSLVKNILYPAVHKHLGGYGKKIGGHESVQGDLDTIANIEFVDQNPIGKSSRSNPVTYVKAYDDIRSLYAEQQLSKQMGYKPSHFSFNVDGGRCEECDGEGKIKIEMQFMADVHLLCEECKGKRFKKDILDVLYRKKSVADILDITVDEAIAFFKEGEGLGEKAIVRKLQPLQNVGMGYVKLGQPSSTLSGGEAQRIKLATFLGVKKLDARAKRTLFVFDEPTTGLHFHDIKKLLTSFNALIEQGHSIVVIEHNMDVIKSADWVIDLGPEGGEEGGNVVCEGVPEKLATATNESYTAQYISAKL